LFLLQWIQSLTTEVKEVLLFLETWGVEQKNVIAVKYAVLNTHVQVIKQKLSNLVTCTYSVTACMHSASEREN